MSMGSPCIGSSGRSQNATTDISHAGRIPRPISPGGLIVSGTVVRPFPRNTGKASVVGYYKHGGGPHAITLRHTRSRFVPRGKWNPEAITAFVIAPSQASSQKKHSSGKSMHIYAWHRYALEVCAVGIRKRACTVTDRTWPEPDWPCAPPHF